MEKELFGIVFMVALSCVLVADPVAGVNEEAINKAYDEASLPSFIASAIGQERVVVHVTNGTPSWDTLGEDRVEAVTIVTGADAGIRSVEDARWENKTFEIAVDRGLLRQAETQESPQAFVVDAYREGRILYRGVGTWNSAVTTTTKTATSTTSSIYGGATSISGWFW